MITLTSLQQGDAFLFAQSVVDALEDAFPGWPWTACVDQGLLIIKNPAASAKWGIRCPAHKVDKAGVLRFGGELLERFGLPYRFDEAALETAKRDFTGEIVSEKWTPDRRYFNKTSKTWKY
jgi:hypothetical protein